MVACKYGTLIQSRLFKLDKHKKQKENDFAHISAFITARYTSSAISRTIPALMAHKIETRGVKDVFYYSWKQGVESYVSSN